VGVNAKVTRLVPKTGKSLDANQVARFVTDGRTHDSDSFAVTWVIAKLVKDLRQDDRLRRCSIHGEPKRSTAWLPRSPDTAIDEDQIVARLKARDRHGTNSS